MKKLILSDALYATTSSLGMGFDTPEIISFF